MYICNNFNIKLNDGQVKSPGYSTSINKKKGNLFLCLQIKTDNCSNNRDVQPAKNESASQENHS